MKNEELIAKLQKLPMDCEILDVEIVPDAYESPFKLAPISF